MSTENGRPFTGRAIACRKPQTDDFLRIDATDLRRAGRFARPCTRKAGGPVWTAEGGIWPYRTRVYYFVLAADGGQPQYVVVWLDQGDPPRLPVDSGFWAVPITTTLPHFSRRKLPHGNPRLWFECPACERRCRIVYVRPDPARLGCQRCMGLTYPTGQASGTWLRAVLRAFKAERALVDEMAARPRRSERRLDAAWRRYEKAHEAVLKAEARR